MLKRHHIFNFYTTKIFDEVKTGCTIGIGGAVVKYGVIPDMITLGKSIGGGTATAALGMSQG